jgi:hypothetical protein
MVGGNVVSAGDIKILSARLAQMIMVADLTIDDKRAVTDQEREYLKTHGRAPLGWLIFLCRADVPVEAGQFYHGDAFHLVDLKGGNAATKLVATFLLGKLCVHALTLPPRAYQGYTGARLIRLWPSAGHELNLLESSLLSPRQIIELGASFRKFDVGN